MILLSAANRFDSYVQFITVLIIFLFVLGITYVLTRWMAKFQKAQLTGRNLEVIETHRIAPSKYLQIVKAGEKYLVIAVCKDTVTMLTEIPKESIDLSNGGTTENLEFKEIWERVRHSVGSLKKTDEK